MGIGLVDRRGRTLESNHLLEELTGFSAGELRELDFNEITHPDDIEPNATLFAEMMEGRRSRFSIDKRMSRKDGRSIWVRVTVSALEHDGEGRPRYALGMIEDITERRRQDDHYSALLGKLTQVQALSKPRFATRLSEWTLPTTMAASSRSTERFVKWWVTAKMSSSECDGTTSPILTISRRASNDLT
jgi:PAS domain S-box-containing protein